MKVYYKLLILIFFIGWIHHSYAYTISTVTCTNLIYNNNFDSGLSGWTAITTKGVTDAITGVSTDGRTVIRLRSLYTNGSIMAQSAIQTWDGTGTTSNYHAIDFSTTSPPTVRDGIIVKVWAKGSGIAPFSNGTVTGYFSVFIQSALSNISFSTSTTISTATPSGDTDTRILESEGFNAISTDSIFGVMSTWNVFTFTFTPQGECDWWQIRNLQISYTAAPHQAVETELVIDRVELYTLQINDQ